MTQATSRSTSQQLNAPPTHSPSTKNGNLLLTVSGYPFVRKVVGGGFYSQCNNADTYIFGGSIQEVYGGALMGYVHKNARLYIGQPNIDMNEWELTRYNFSRHTNLSVEELASVNADRRENAYNRNHSLFIVGNVYGGNDVKGVVGTSKWYDKYKDEYTDEEIETIETGSTTRFGMESSDNAPLYCSDVEAVDTKGVTMTINGGTICGNVYGVGNGHYRGYYVPGWARYGDGPARQYRKALLPGKTHADYKVNTDGTDNADQVYGNVYRCRPMTGKVTIHISGNGTDDQGRMDSVSIRGNVYGGGRACTLGQWNTALPYEDPRRLTKGGFLHINIGSNVNIDGSVYMGSEGTEFATAHEVPSDIDLSTFKGTTSEELDKLGAVAYDHWYYDATDKYYKPGFPAADQVGGNIGIYGEHMYRAYFKNIEMQGDVEITFYNEPFEKENGEYVKTYDSDDEEYFVRRRWVPGEMAISEYDATNITINSFYGGGACGSMTNNNQMYWNYTTGKITDLSDVKSTDEVEKNGAIYRYILSPGVTILDRVVGGSENATNRYYGYEADNKTLRASNDDNLIYEFEGGMVTQSTYTYYLLAYNADKGQNIHDVKPSEYLGETYEKGLYTTKYEISEGSYIAPQYYTQGLKTVPNALYLQNPRFAIAVSADANGNALAGYCGAREDRPDKTVLKLTVANQFEPQKGEQEYTGSVEDPTEHYYHFGGVIYGGCYDSGVTQGDVMVSVLSNTIGKHLSEKDPTTFDDISTLEHNIGRVFGGGYGSDSRVDGDTYVNLMHHFVGMNVFGGGCQGNVNGMTHIKYVGDEANSFVFGAIYGGGLYGNVGVALDANNPDHDPTPIATEVRLFSGNVDKVYGGACLGDLYGRTHVELCDEVYDQLEYFNYGLLTPTLGDWSGARLIAGTVFGGNDVSGNIYPQPTAGEALNKEEVENNNAKPDYGINAYSTYVKVHEIVQQPTQAPSAAPALSEEVNPGKESPGASNGYNGFPLIGDLYGGSNGSYGSHSGLDYYEGGTYRLASGLGNHVIEFDLAPDPTEDYAGFQVPHVEKAYLDIQGGTLINVYGGGDKATITGETNLNVNYSPTDSIMRARAGFAGSDALVRIWNTFHLSDEEQIEEVTTTTGTGDDANTIFNYHIYRIYGGNNNADMAIQPTWNLVSGYLGSVYSGGNFGKMTYCKATGNKVDYTDATTNTTTQVPELEALKLVINSSTLHADAVFGGGRVGDIEPDITGALKNATPTTLTLTNDNYITYNPNFYGATLEINDGVVDHVYGGNDVSGTVYQGSRVKITGAISGDVYCAGNGNYRYQYDYTNDADGAKIAEAYGSDNYGGRYFILPMRTEKDGNEYVYGGSTNPTPTQILQAINAYRPNVERTYLTIEGTGPVYGKDSEGNDIVTKEAVTAFVRGNVYCGGNSSTVNHSDATDTNGDIKFEIGSYVVLNGVFLGSNGESLVDPDMMEVTERLNGIDLTEACDLKDYPALLDLYMQAVEITGLPKDFNLSPSLQEAYIGDFYVGGNNGSMLTDKTIGLTFPYNLVIYNRIVGGSNSANVTYRGTSHIGGLTTPLSTETVINSKGVEEPKYTDKVYLQVRSQFKPFKIKYVDDVDNRSISLVPDLDYDGSHIYFPEGKCSIFGGCYNSGRTVGNIHIDLYSDMVKEWDTSTFSDYFDDLKQEATDMGYDIDWANVSIDELFSKDRVIVNGIDQLQRRSFALIGGGYGSATEVLGNIKLHMLPGQFHPDYYYYDELGNVVKTEGDLSPSTATIFGGSQQGSVIGNTEIAVRDGMVLSNLYGGSEAAPLYGSTQIMIGWPQYYKCNVRGHYRLKRNDDISRAAIGKWKNSDGADKETVLRDIWLREGEYISPNLFEALVSVVTTSTDLTTGETTDTESTIPTDNFTFVGDDLPQFYAAHNNSPYVEFHKINWDDIDIYIGNGRSRRDERQEYFAHGNVYGGGFITSNSSTSLAGQFTVKKFDELNNNDENDIGYGGNSSIMIWDNIENRDTRNVVGETAQYDYTGAAYESDDNPAKIRDHITIGTGHYVEVTMYPGMDVMGKYIFEPTETGRSYLYVGTGKGDYEYNSTSNSYSAKSGGDYKRGDYIAQSSKILTDKDFNTDGTSMDTYYEIESDGGVYGGGRKVYVEGFRNCDLAYYGYADYCPQFPKLLNTAQRLDLFTVTDCCFFLEGANDFSTNTIDATNYSLTRIGELQMRSSISADAALDPGTRQTSGLFNSEHLNARCRNYIGFFHDVLYVAAMTSNVAFDQAYRGADGMLYSLNAPSGNPTSSTGSSSTTWATDDDYTYLDATFTYQDYKKNRIENYYANCNNASSSETLKRATSLEFDQRNVGTAANMIGINNGYTLKVQGAGLNNGIEDIYYGPVTGVFEVKLMTLSTDEGGGYIYALNQHDDPNHFLETTGNFIFPGAAYKLSSTGNEYNYIYDDCFPYGLGWENYYGWTGASSAMHPRKASTAVDTGHGDCNALQEVHYWFVNGSQFTFNVNLTGVTYNNPKSFTLNSRDLLTYLYGVPSCDKVTLEEVYWTPINGISWTSTGWSGTDESGYTSDLQDLSPADQAANAKGYKLYLTLDNIPATEYTESSGREVIGLPRASTYVENNNLVSLDQDFYGNGSLSYSSTIVNSDGEKEDNMPLLGITLYDPVVNTGTDYYNNHMAENENVRIVLYGRDSSGNKLFQYTINLTINYLMGPSISGVPRIENCALPGEYIYANADDVVVLLDDSNLAITGHNWYIMKGDLGTSETAIAEAIKTIPTGSNIGEDIECINDQRISNVETEIHIPAYYYRDGWNLVYEIVANNSDDMRFYRTPYSEDNTDTTTVASEESEGTEGSESTGGTGTTVTTTEDTELKHLVVHNYHRMRPYDGASRNDDGTIKLEDLRLTAGARIYIEDQDDMDYFFKWLNDSCMTRPNPRVTASGLDINPENAEGLIVHLMADLDMPRNPGVDVSNLEFAGIFHGNGHSIDMGSNNMFLGTNQGVFYNTGFICKSDNTTVFGANTSDTDKGLWGCFLFNNDDRTKGLMVAGDNGSIYNCYRTSGATTANNVVGLTLATDDEFTYGEIAYDLNHFYLKKRYNRATNTSDGTFMLPLNDIFYDGDYRYSRVQDADQPWALRTTEVPNYHDINIKRTEVNTGHLATHHYTTDDQDLTRLAQDAAGNALLDKDGNEYYLPIFPDDYRFFGQDLSYGQKDEPWPHAVVKDQIVYRASGFYGSKLDQGFHFNEDAVAQQPSLTAIDFYGVRDEEYGVASTNGYSIDYDGDDAKSEFRHIWYAPAVDLPDAYATETVENHGILSFTTASQEENREIGDYDSTNGTLTRNLLVYRPDEMSVLAPYDNTEVRAENIYYHVIDATASSTDSEGNVTTAMTPNADYFQLIDREDFNCPIAFDVNKTIWYRRTPELFSNGNDAWDGLCLPFTARTVFGSIDGQPIGYQHNHGELSHFYGEHVKADNKVSYLETKADSHEYWLRKFTEIKDSKAYFERPGSENDLSANADLQEAKIATYHYSNQYFSALYGDSYYTNNTHGDQAPGYTEKGIDYKDYPMITARYPYIISFPGKRYREFDCSGEFFATYLNTSNPGCQTITYADTQPQKILMTDAYTEQEFTHNGYTFKGSYMHRSLNAYQLEIDTNNGQQFERGSASRMIEPFRTYLVSADNTGQSVQIASRGIDSIGEGDDEEDGDSQESNILFSIESNELVIDNPYDVDFEFGLYDLNGRYLRSVTATPGLTRVSSLSPGYYLISTFKFRIN
ncbi:MAG: hypothetical protein LIP03_01180 [Bacteroidales bacterium]|nr:hypothetical protein [Bacteroidales bacterium]